MIDSGHLDGMVDVVQESVDGRQIDFLDVGMRVQRIPHGGGNLPGIGELLREANIPVRVVGEKPGFQHVVQGLGIQVGGNGEDSHHTAVPGQGPQHLVRKVALHPAQGPATGMGGDDRSGAGTDRVPESLVRGMGDIHQHPDPVALPNHLPAEITQPGLGVQLPAGVNPVESSNMGQREDPDPHAVIHPQDGQIVVDPARVEHGDHRNLPRSDDSLQVRGLQGQLHGIRVLPHALLQYLVDALQGPLDHVRAVKQIVANVLAHRGRIDDSFTGIATEDFFYTDSVNDGVDVPFLEVFQVQLPVGVDDDGIAMQLGRV